MSGMRKMKECTVAEERLVKRGIRSKRRNCHEWNAAHHLLISITSYNGCRRPHNATRLSPGTSSREITRRFFQQRSFTQPRGTISPTLPFSLSLLLPSLPPRRTTREARKKGRCARTKGTRTKGGGDVTECFIYRAGKPRLCTTPPVHDTPACLGTLVYKHEDRPTVSVCLLQSCMAVVGSSRYVIGKYRGGGDRWVNATSRSDRLKCIDIGAIIRDNRN